MLAGGPPLAAQAPPQEGILVLAAASLTDVLPILGRDWEAAGGVPVEFSFAATSRLAPQALQGARADLFVAANEEWMDWVEARDGIQADTRRVVAGNALVLAVPASSGAELASMADLVGPGIRRVALADDNVPAGRYAQGALVRAGLWDAVRPKVVRGGSVRGALEWIARGEVDAGFVYATDVRAQARVRVALEVPLGAEAGVRYSAAVLARSDAPGDARSFLDFLAGPSGQRVLSASGFTAPSAGSGPGGGPPVPEVAATPPNPWSAIRLSLIVAMMATAIGLFPAMAGGWVLARKQFPGKSLFATAMLAPLVLPPVVTGFLLLSVFGARSSIGGGLAALGVHVPFTVVGAALAALVVGLPLYVMAIRGAFEAVDTRFEELSWTLGVHRSATFRRVTLPLALPGIAAGAVLAFARALGEFGATIVLAGSVEGSTRTIALAVYSLLESPSGRETTWWLVGASVAISLVALLGFEALNRRQRARVEDHRA